MYLLLWTMSRGWPRNLEIQYTMDVFVTCIILCSIYFVYFLCYSFTITKDHANKIVTEPKLQQSDKMQLDSGPINVIMIFLIWPTFMGSEYVINMS